MLDDRAIPMTEAKRRTSAEVERAFGSFPKRRGRSVDAPPAGESRPIKVQRLPRDHKPQDQLHRYPAGGGYRIIRRLKLPGGEE